MLKLLRYVFSLVAMVFAVYGLITSDFNFQPYMLLFLGLMLLVMGIEEFQKEKKASGWSYYCFSIFIIYIDSNAFIALKSTLVKVEIKNEMIYIPEDAFDHAIYCCA